MPVFECRTDLRATKEQLFDFIIRPANLQAIAPPDMQLVFVSPPETIALGHRLTCKAQAYGIVQQVTYEIVELEPVAYFREKMVEGPLGLWIQDHIVEAHPSPDHVTLVNRIEFEPPGGLLGFIVTPDSILRTLEDGFEYRQDALKKHFAKLNP